MCYDWSAGAGLLAQAAEVPMTTPLRSLLVLGFWKGDKRGGGWVRGDWRGHPGGAGRCTEDHTPVCLLQEEENGGRGGGKQLVSPFIKGLCMAAPCPPHCSTFALCVCPPWASFFPLLVIPICFPWVCPSPTSMQVPGVLQEILQDWAMPQNSQVTLSVS